MEMKFALFQSLLKDLSLYDKYFPILLENGFDDWESLTGANPEILKEIGINNDLDIKQILASINSADAVEEEKSNPIPKKSNLPSNNYEKSMITTAYPAQEKAMTQACILKGTTLKKERFESNEKFFNRLTHITLNDMGFTKIENLDLCKKLQYLSLYNNEISKIEGLDSLTNLVQLHLERNRIKRMENLKSLTQLKKLYLTNNKIQRVEGLENCSNLEELYISDQRLKGNVMSFDPSSMAVISASLRILEAENNNILNISPLAYLSEVETLKLQNNNVKHVDDIEKLLACMTNLKVLDLRGNPIEKVNKIRDQVFMMSNSLETFNDKEILKTERDFLYKFYNIKGSRNEKKPTNSQTQVQAREQFEVNGLTLKNTEDAYVRDKMKANLNNASEFHSNTVHVLSKKSSLKK